jgi:predicted AlkP superfamily pyrophosphatase or phosphodiesterase
LRLRGRAGLQACRFHVAALAILFALALGVFTSAQRGTDDANRVVIISLDGFPASALQDPQNKLPTLRRLASAGAVAKGMRPVNPTVTWANHTSLVTGVTPAKHGVIFNGLLIRQPGVPPRIEAGRDRNELVHARTLYDAAHDRGLTTAQVDWVAIQNAPTITWEFPERPAPDGAIARELVKTNAISEADLASFPKHDIEWRDEMWTRAATHILREHHPHLLLFHLLALDSTQHRFGPRTPEARAAIARLDTQVAAIVDTLGTTRLASRTTVFIVSDHGFKTVRRRIHPNVALMRAGLIREHEGKVSEADAYVVSEGGTALVYVTKPDPSGVILSRVRRAVAGIEGIDRIVESPDYPRYGLPLPAASDQMGPLMLVAKDGYAFSDSTSGDVVNTAATGSLGAHGYVNSDPELRALFIASGRGVKHGAVLDSIENLSVAPTAAQLLGVQLQETDGRVLTQILVQ